MATLFEDYGGTNALKYAQFGLNGFEILDSLSVIDENTEFYFIEAWGEAANIDVDVANLAGTVDEKAGIDLADGRSIVGKFTALVINSGTVIAYYA